MSQVTVKQLAEVLGIEMDRLLEQLQESGVKLESPDQAVSNAQKMQLLSFLRNSHGKDDKDIDSMSKITLKRKSVSELKVNKGHGRSKTINVEFRKRRTYVKRSSLVETDEMQADREEAAEVLSQSPLKQEEDARNQEVQRKIDAEEAIIKAAEDKIRIESEALEQAEREARFGAQEKTRLELEEKERKVAEEQARVDAEARAKVEAEDKLKQQQQAQAQKEKALQDSKPSDKKRRKDKKSGSGTRYGREQLHVANKGRGKRRGKGSQQVQPTDQHAFSKPTEPVVRSIEVPENITVAELAKLMAVKASEVIKILMGMGAMVTINQVIDQDTAMVVVDEMGHKPVVAKEQNIETELLDVADEPEGETSMRPPIVTVMGHVDHGKTSLLDYIRKTKVTKGEAGGITQHIGAYSVSTERGNIAFLDTPGHAAFTAMRARGAQATDIVILVVAADDGVKPQTIEAIQHARAAKVPLIVAVNKIDREEADPERCRTELSQHEVIPEEWGGEDIFVNVSAHTGEGIPDLLEAILLQAEVMELSAVIDSSAKGIIVESALDKGRGAVATVLVQNGTLKQGDMLLCDQEFGRVRAMFDDSGKQVQSAGPSVPVLVLGLSGIPLAGADALVVADEKKAREVAEFRKAKHRETRFAQQQAAKLEKLFAQMGSGDQKQVNIVLKADVHGSNEALRDALTRMSNEDVQVSVVGSGVGGITESDINLAITANALVIGFNVRADASARRVLNENDIEVNYYSVIYDAIDDVKRAIEGVLGTEVRERIVGLAEVRDVFRSSKLGAIAGSIVVDGLVKKDNPIRVLRDSVVIFEGELESLRRYKDDVAEVKAGTECGIGVKQYNDIKAGDNIECFERYEVQRSID